MQNLICMVEKTVWISFDLGLKGDYKGLYAWLDKHAARECGDSLAVLKYDTGGKIPDAIEHEIKQSVDLSPSDRVYIIWKDETGLVKGKFIKGGRKRAPWIGFGQSGDSQIEDF